MKPGATDNAASPADITVNPKDLKVVEREAAQRLRRIDDADFVCIPMNCVISGKFSPEKQGFCFEDRRAPLALNGDRRASGQREVGGR